MGRECVEGATANASLGKQLLQPRDDSIEDDRIAEKAPKESRSVLDADILPGSTENEICADQRAADANEQSSETSPPTGEPEVLISFDTEDFPLSLNDEVAAQSSDVEMEESGNARPSSVSGDFQDQPERAVPRPDSDSMARIYGVTHKERREILSDFMRSRLPDLQPITTPAVYEHDGTIFRDFAYISKSLKSQDASAVSAKTEPSTSHLITPPRATEVADLSPSEVESPQKSSKSSPITPETIPATSKASYEESIKTHLDSDTAVLREFLSRAAASKASKGSIAKRTSLSHRRDSGAVRQALASPRPALEDKDPNAVVCDSTLNAANKEIPTPTAEAEVLAANDKKSKPYKTSKKANDPAKENIEHLTKSRRSTRTRNKLPPPTPHPASTTAPPPYKIPVRRTDGAEPVVLKKTEAQEIAQLTRTNTRKNKSGAVVVPARLLKLSVEAAKNPQVDGIVEKVIQDGEKGVRWDTQLVYFFRTSDTITTVPAPEPVIPLSIATPSCSAQLTTARAKRLSALNAQPFVSDKVPSTDPEREGSNATPPASKIPQTPRLRRLQGLGAVNGTPANGLLASTLHTDLPPVKDLPRKKSKLAAPRKLKLQPNGEAQDEGKVDGMKKKAESGDVRRATIGAGEGLAPGLVRRGARRRATVKS